MEKGWTSAQLAAPTNSVRTADEQLCDVGVAGLSLRDITCKRTDASRHRKIAGIKVCTGKLRCDEVAQLVLSTPYGRNKYLICMFSTLANTLEELCVSRVIAVTKKIRCVITLICFLHT